MGPAHAYKASMNNKWDLGNFWIWQEYKMMKSKENPMSFDAKGWMGWDGANKHYVWAGVDSMGGWVNLTSTDNSIYTGDGSPMGKKNPVKFTFVPGKDKKGQDSDKLFDVTLEFPGVATSHESCKK